ncbi:MAG: DNA recombination protein RmuC [Proteobacteria bacterium]|nr:DNA recombination protein RmuC [Pseudomonadota bacterium]
MEYILSGSAIVAVILLFFIYQKVSQKNQNEDPNQISLANISERLGIIEAAQTNIENLNKNLTDFKNLFGDKSRRGKLGEEYLEDIVKDVLLEKHYSFQHTLSNSKRVDCLLKFGSTNENIAIDSKFSWENYEKFKEENDENLRKGLLKEFEKDINNHIKAISEKYVVPGETAPLAIMFVASEGVFRVIEEISEDLVKMARQKNVIITSPSTLWGFLRTYKLLIQNREMYEQTHVIQKEVSALAQLINTFTAKFKDLDARHSRNSDLIEELKSSVSKISKTSNKIQNLDLENKSELTNNRKEVS